jgi:hypothetical protein
MLFRRVIQIPTTIRSELSKDLLEGLARPILECSGHMSPFVYRTHIVEENDFWIEYQKLIYHLRFFMKPVVPNFYVNSQQTFRCDTRLIRTWCKLDVETDTLYTLSLMENVKYADRYLCVNNYYDLVSKAIWSPDIKMMKELEGVETLTQTIDRKHKRVDIQLC